MKKCKSCQTEIDSKAKKCPHCQADQRNWFAKHKILTGILVIILIGIISSTGGNKDTNKSSSTPSTVSNSKQEQKTYKIGEVINTGTFEITTVSANQKAVVGGQYVNEKASEGATLLAVNWKYKNISDKPASSYSQPSVKLVDSNGTEYEWDLGKSSTYAVEQKIDSKVLSDLNPGITVNDAKVFEVSKESYAKGGWKLKFTVGGKEFVVEL